MPQPQTPTRPHGVVGRMAALLVVLAATIGGTAAMVQPFVHAAPVWRWAPRQADDLAGASVNAELASIDQHGALLTRQGWRHISIITPPLHLPEDANRVLVIEACRPRVAADQPLETVVRLLWQSEAAKEYHFESQTVALSSRLAEVRFSLPAAPATIYRLGVQFPDLEDTVLVRSLSLPMLRPIERVRLAWSQAAVQEPIGNHSINYIRGPHILGHSSNYYLLALLGAAVGLYGLVQSGRRRRLSPRVVMVLALATWVAADAQATRNLARQARTELREFRGKTRPEQIALMDGVDIAWAYSRLLESVPDGGSFTVLSDDPFTPSRRLAYLLAPQRRWRESLDDAEFIVVLRASDALLSERTGMFKWNEHPWIRVELVTAVSADVYLLKRFQGPFIRPSSRPSPSREKQEAAPPAGRALP